mgnify:CR=1 FL=1
MSLPARNKKFEAPGQFSYEFKVLNHDRVLVFDNEKCIGCGLCVYACPIEGDVISVTGRDDEQISINLEKCVHCGACDYFCPADALTLYINGDERIELKEPAGEVERHSLPDFEFIELKRKNSEQIVRKYLRGALLFPDEFPGNLKKKAIEACPTGALSMAKESSKVKLDEKLCFFCDACSNATGGAIRVSRNYMMMEFSEGVPPLIKRIIERLMGEKTASRLLKGVSQAKGQDQVKTLMRGLSKE